MAGNPKKSSEENKRKWNEIVKKASEDETFKQRLLHKPKTVLEEYGMEVPHDIALKIVENTSKIHHVILAEPEAIDDLSEEELKMTSGAAEIHGIRIPYAYFNYTPY